MNKTEIIAKAIDMIHSANDEGERIVLQTLLNNYTGLSDTDKLCLYETRINSIELNNTINQIPSVNVDLDIIYNVNNIKPLSDLLRVGDVHNT